MRSTPGIGQPQSTARSARASLDEYGWPSSGRGRSGVLDPGPGHHTGASNAEYLLPVSLRHDSVMGSRVLHAAVDRSSVAVGGALRALSPEAVISLAVELGLALERAEPWEGEDEGEASDGGGEADYGAAGGDGCSGDELGWAVVEEATDEALPLRSGAVRSDLHCFGSGGGGGTGGGRRGEIHSSQQQQQQQQQQQRPMQLIHRSLPGRPVAGESQLLALPHANGGAQLSLHSQASTLRSLYRHQQQHQRQHAEAGAVTGAQGFFRHVTTSLDDICSVQHEDSGLPKPQRLRQWLVHVLMQLRLMSKVLSAVARRKPWVAAAPVVLCLLLCGLGVFGVIFASQRFVDGHKAYVQEAVASATATAISNQLEMATFAIMAVSAYVTQRPLCSDLDQNFQNLSSTVLNWDEKSLVYQLQALPSAVLQYIYPPVSGELSRQLIGRDLLRVPMYRNDTLYQIRQRDKRLLLGPYDLLEGFKGMFATYPIFLPAPDALYDWGCGLEPYECPPGVCWIAGEGKKLWGLATSVLSLDNMQADFRFQALIEQGYRYRLLQLPDNINAGAVIAVSDPPPSAPISTAIVKFNLVWRLEVSPKGGWQPGWRGPCVAAVVVGSALVAGLVLWLLLAREKHDALLSAMLPRKVIRQLQRGEQTVVEEFMEPVTILFSDIVSYTEVASQLTALQVVRLLNDLYTQFDALCDKHGVYKVETIGDAFMCVAGCPSREDPIKAAVRMAGMAQDMIAMVEKFSTRVGSEDMRVKIRVGLHSGPVVAGVIGQRMPRYCLFGDTVNTASRMETNSQPMCVHLSAATASLLRRAGAAVMLPVRPLPPLSRPPAPPSPLGFGCSSQHAPRASLPSASGQPPAASTEGTLSLILDQQDHAGGEPWQQQQPQLQEPATHLSLPAPRQLGQRRLAGCGGGGGGRSDGGELWRMVARGSDALVPPLTLFGRGRVMIKGKGMMHTFWLGSPPQPPQQQPQAAAAAAQGPSASSGTASLPAPTTASGGGLTAWGRRGAVLPTPAALPSLPTSSPNATSDTLASAPGRRLLDTHIVASIPCAPHPAPAAEGSFTGSGPAAPAPEEHAGAPLHPPAMGGPHFSFTAAPEPPEPPVAEASPGEAGTLLPAGGSDGGLVGLAEALHAACGAGPTPPASAGARSRRALSAVVAAASRVAGRGAVGSGGSGGGSTTNDDARAAADASGTTRRGDSGISGHEISVRLQATSASELE